MSTVVISGISQRTGIDRRTFLKGAAAGMCLALTPYPLTVWARQPDRVIGELHQDIFGEVIWEDGSGSKEWGNDDQPAESAPQITKSTQPSQAYYPGRLPVRVPATGEAYTLPFRTGDQYDPRAFQWVNWLFRCHGDRDAVTVMDYRLIEQLNYISHWFGGAVIQVHSGYRTPRYNKKLGERNRKVAPNSFHMAGRAIDFSVPDVKLRDVCSVALYCRNMVGFGGVGYYPKDGFIHVDSGPIRQWIS